MDPFCFKFTNNLISLVEGEADSVTTGAIANFQH